MSSQQPQTGRAIAPKGPLDAYFKISARGSHVRQEVIAGLTTFLAMVYSVIVVPSMLGKAGFSPSAVFVATCLVAGFGSLLMGLWANLPLAIGCAISLTAFTAFSLVLGQHISVPVALGAVFLMGVLFTIISVTGIRSWILRNLPMGVAHGTGIGIGLFLLLIAANGVGLVVSLPMLTFLAMLSGIVGGGVVCAVALDISPAMFLSLLKSDIGVQHFLVGMVKAPIFAFLIAAIGCLEGFKVSGSAESVGAHTTSSVVQSIFVVIVLDAVAALFFMEMGW